MSMNEFYQQGFHRNLSINPTVETVIKAMCPQLTMDIADDFIAIFDNAFNPDYCQSVINYYEKLNASGAAYYRSQMLNKPSPINLADQSIDFANQSFYVADEINFKSLNFAEIFWKICYPAYVEKYSILSQVGKHNIEMMKIQKTEPMQGYHVWHCESDNREHGNRVLAFNVYLNDVAEGGETEFLYQKRRVAAKVGRVAIWPAAFTHTHRGNPPLSNTKYIITGWVEY